MSCVLMHCTFKWKASCNGDGKVQYMSAMDRLQEGRRKKACMFAQKTRENRAEEREGEREKEEHQPTAESGQLQAAHATAKCVLRPEGGERGSGGSGVRRAEHSRDCCQRCRGAPAAMALCGQRHQIT